jgi:hypothetical protein
LPTPGLTQEHRVVFALAPENHHHALDLALPADHRIEPAGPSLHRQVHAKIVELEGSRHRKIYSRWV